MKIAKIVTALVLLVSLMSVTCFAAGNILDVGIWTEGSLTPMTQEKTADSLTLVSTNDPTDWWKVKVELPRFAEAGKTYDVTFTFTSNATGTIKYNLDGAAQISGNEYNVVNGDNTFTARVTAGNDTYNCLELGGLGKFTLTFTEISVKEVVEGEQPGEHTHKFVNGLCTCGLNNGFTGFGVWTEGALTPVTREDSENTMTVVSTNDPADWWKVKVELPRFAEAGKTYDVTFKFTSNATGTIKYNLDGAAQISGNEYNVVNGDNTFTVRLTAGNDTYNCLELGGLGKFTLTFTEISVQEVVETPEEPGQTPEDPAEPPKTGDNVLVAVAVALVSAMSVTVLLSKKEN